MERLTRRREQLGPGEPARAGGVRGGARARRGAREPARRPGDRAARAERTLIRDTDRQIQETFEQTFAAAARNFEELVGDVFPGGSGRLRLVRDEHAPRAVLGGQSPREGASGRRRGRRAVAEAAEAAAEAEAELDERR